MTALITMLALTLTPQQQPTPVPLLAVPWEKPTMIAMPLPLVELQSFNHYDSPNLMHAIDGWFEVDARNEAWYAAEREQWLATEAANKEQEQARPRVAAFTPTPSLPWLHAWITDEILWELRQCESTNNYSVNTGNGFRGAVQWLQNTWNAAAARAERPDLIGVPPNLAAPADQDYLTKVWWQASDYRGQWPRCSLVAIAKAG